MKVNSSATKFFFSTVVGIAAADWDPACIHTGCMKENGAVPKWDPDASGTDSMGACWYCNDGQEVGGHVHYDQAYIYDCHIGVHYNKENDPGAWYCKDNGPWGAVNPAVYIHGGCDSAQWRTNSDCQNDFGGDCAFGDGWYCTDSEDVSDWDPDYFDYGFIPVGCGGIYFNDDLSAWYCADASHSQVIASE